MPVVVSINGQDPSGWLSKTFEASDLIWLENKPNTKVVKFITGLSGSCVVQYKEEGSNKVTTKRLSDIKERFIFHPTTFLKYNHFLSNDCAGHKKTVWPSSLLELVNEAIIKSPSFEKQRIENIKLAERKVGEADKFDFNLHIPPIITDGTDEFGWYVNRKSSMLGDITVLHTKVFELYESAYSDVEKKLWHQYNDLVKIKPYTLGFASGRLGGKNSSLA